MPERVHTKFDAGEGEHVESNSLNGVVSNNVPGSHSKKLREAAASKKSKRKHNGDLRPNGSTSRPVPSESDGEQNKKRLKSSRSESPVFVENGLMVNETSLKHKAKDGVAQDHKASEGFRSRRPDTSAEDPRGDAGTARNNGLHDTNKGSAFEFGSTRKHRPSSVASGEVLKDVKKPGKTFDQQNDAGKAVRPKQADLDAKAKILRPVREDLPIFKHRQSICSALQRNDILLVVGETGSGKSTQIPQYLMQQPWCKVQNVEVKRRNGAFERANVGGVIAITEPRRVAVTSLARRVAEECGSHIGPGISHEKDKVGYSIRFDSCVPRKAKIKFLTEGVLLQELLKDPYLLRYSCVIIDEIHERSIDVDLLAGFIKKIVKGDLSFRGGVPLKVVIMSATANMSRITEFFSTDLDSPVQHHATNPENQHKSLNGIELSSLEQNHISSQASRNKKTTLTPARAAVTELPSSPTERSSEESYSSWSGIVSENDLKETKDKIISQSPGPVASAKRHQPGEALSPSRPIGNPTPRIEDKVSIQMISGKTYPVEIFYLPDPPLDYIEAALKTIFIVHMREPFPGDILVFFTGQEEIETVAQMITDLVANPDNEITKKGLPGIQVNTLYGTQTMEEQQKVFNPIVEGFTRRIILATNIAETSVTVPGVRYVIDTGRVKTKEFRQRLGLQSLLVKPISKSSAIQRKGRAGREAKGKCYRLYTEKQYLDLVDDDVPEILRSDIVDAVLTMKLRGIDDVATFPLLDAPEPKIIQRALFELLFLGAVDEHGRLTVIGERMGSFPLPAAYARVLVAAADPRNDCLLEAIDVISILNAEDIFIQPKTDEKRDEVEELRRDVYRREGDIITYLTVMQKYVDCSTNRLEWCRKRYIHTTKMKHAANIRRQLRTLCKRCDWVGKVSWEDQSYTPMDPERTQRLLRCFLEGFPNNTATRHPDGSYRMTGTKNIIYIHPSSVLLGQKPQAFLYLEDVYSSKNYAKRCSVVQLDWITELIEQSLSAEN